MPLPSERLPVCGPAVAWDWFILDISYVLLLVGGGGILRARSASFLTWIWFGMLAASVGGFLFAATWVYQVNAPDITPTSSAVAAMTGC